MAIANRIAEGIMKYQNFFSKKVLSSTSSKLISQAALVHSI
jgi:hypothetical protein